MANELVVSFEDADCRMGLFRSLVVSAWRGAPSTARMSALMAQFQRLHSQPDPIGAIAVVNPRPDLKLDLNDVVRGEMVKGFRSANGRGGASAFAIEGGGFLGAAARSLMSGVLLLARPSYPTKIFDNREAGAKWITPLTQNKTVGTFTEAELLAVVAKLFEGLA